MGKTTVAERLTAHLSPVAVVPLDWLRHMVGAWDPSSEDEAVLASRNAAALARNFVSANYHVIIEGLLDHPAALSALLTALGDLTPRVITLWASWNELLRRHNGRPPNHRASLQRISTAYQRIGNSRREAGGVCIETDSLTPDQIVALLLTKVR